MTPTIPKTLKIAMVDLQRQYQQYKADIDQCMQNVLDHSQFIMGPEVADLERELAQFTQSRFAIGCASGTEALVLALMAQDLKPGDEIITTPFSFFASSEAIVFLGAQPVFVDIREDTFNIDFRGIEAAVTPKTRGILAVNLFGQCADYDEINTIADKHNLFVIEDAAQSFGAEYKHRKSCSLSTVGCTSFFPAKPLGCYGDGGMMFTDDEAVAKKVQSLRVHGSGRNKNENIYVGLNSRLDTLQAAILLAKLKYFPNEIQSRQRCAKYYTEHLCKDVKTPIVLNHNQSVYAQYSVRVPNRDQLREHLKSMNIPTAIHYPKILPHQEALSGLPIQFQPGDFPIAEKISQDILALPMHPFLTEEEQDHIIQSINQYYQNP